MPLTGEEIRRRLGEFSAAWGAYDGSERAEAQTFLNKLFHCFGTDRVDVARFEDPQHGRFLDLIWDRVCIIEMKRPSEAAQLARHRPQAFDYWRNAADVERNLPAPRYLVLCAFRSFEIWEPGLFPNAPRATFDIGDLPDRLDSLLFLAGREPVFLRSEEGVTREAVKHVTDLYAELRDRRAADPDVLRDFVLQTVWSMFAEDLGQLEGHVFTRIVDDLIVNPQRSSADDLGGLFTWLNTPGERPGAGVYADTRYVNGGLFANPAHVHLAGEELEQLRAACEFDWKSVEPHIFGSLLEGALGRDSQWALGAHYTHVADIMKVIGPSIVAPWRERIESANTVAEAHQLQSELLNYVVLDPACGSGNFLYVAYRELRELESRLSERERELRKKAGMHEARALSAFFPLSNIRGIEIDAFAVALAKVTLWMGHKLAVDELGLNEATLPLEDLSGIQIGDALRVDWPRCNVIVGNPPFHGDRQLRGLLGDAYVEWLKEEFNCGIKDHCVYWFRKAQDHLQPGQRAGLVGTNSISQNRAREASLEYVIDRGGTIVDAISSQDWPGLANVDVSIVNWIDDTRLDGAALLDGVEIEEPIAASLRPWSLAVERADRLPANEGFAFYGPIPGGTGFVLTAEEAEALLERHGDDWRQVIRPYLVGDDILSRPNHGASRFIIDFGFRSLEEAVAFGDALDIVRERVKPQRDRVRRRAYRENWWRFSEPIREMRAALAGLDRYIAGPAQGKRIQFTWVDAWTCPSNLTTVFSFDDNYSMGILSSRAHRAWAIAQASTLEDRTRYTTTSTFDTFPWPTSSPDEQKAISEAAEIMIGIRDSLCLENGLGLTDLYNLEEDGAFKDLRRAQVALDQAVARAYGWPPNTVDDEEMNRRLLALNLQIVSGSERYAGPNSEFHG